MFGDDRLRGLWVAGGQILAFPIDFDRRPYNTLALPCECVISVLKGDANLSANQRTSLRHTDSVRLDLRFPSQP